MLPAWLEILYEMRLYSFSRFLRRIGFITLYLILFRILFCCFYVWILEKSSISMLIFSGFMYIKNRLNNIFFIKTNNASSFNQPITVVMKHRKSLRLRFYFVSNVLSLTPWFERIWVKSFCQNLLKQKSTSKRRQIVVTYKLKNWLLEILSF